MKITKDSVVSMHYTLRDQAGTVLDSSEGREPLMFLQGHGQIIPGLEKALDGLAIGDHLDVSIAPEEAYGVRQEELQQDIPLSAFGGVDKVEVGMQFQAQSPQGPMLITVVEVGEESVKVDGNHPLAGQTLFFAVDIETIRDATAEELEHGHAHAPGHHHH